MTHQRLIYLCNALDEETCRERSIVTDSPAATKKVLDVAAALRCEGIDAVVLSLGRGGQRGTGRWYVSKVARVNGVPLVYAPFFDWPVLTHLVTLVGLLPLLWRLRRNNPATVVMAYNRLPHYWLALELAGFLKVRLYLDLEDGDVRSGPAGIRGRVSLAFRDRLNRLCSTGAVLASDALSKQYPGDNIVCCYGVAELSKPTRDWNADTLVVHLGGTLQQDTGVGLFIEAVELLRCLSLTTSLPVEFVVTGRGAMSADLEKLAARPGWPKVTYLGSVSWAKYQETITSAHVGLCLKLPSSDLGDTTFPSKVVEIASAGLLLLTTEVSDVPKLFGRQGALYLNEERAQSLADLIAWVLSNRTAAASIATEGQRQIAAKCDAQVVGRTLKQFFFSSTLPSGGRT